MGQPRHVVPGASYLLTRRCYQRMFRLRPSPKTNEIFLYCLALAALKTGTRIMAGCGMSNHHHLVVRDQCGDLPNFLREFHRATAKAINTLQGQSDNMWAAKPTSAVRLVDENDIIDKMAYCAANPVESGLVEDPDDWPGPIFWKPQEIVVRRPDTYFDPSGDAPETITLRIESPVSDQGEDAVRAFKAKLKAAIARKVAAARRAWMDAGKSFLGRAGVLAKSFVERAKSREPKRTMVPEVAAKDAEARQMMIERLGRFRAKYREALRAWKAGDREVKFPAGTWWMRVHHCAECEPITADA